MHSSIDANKFINDWPSIAEKIIALAQKKAEASIANRKRATAKNKAKKNVNKQQEDQQEIPIDTLINLHLDVTTSIQYLDIEDLLNKNEIVVNNGRYSVQI